MQVNYMGKRQRKTEISYKVYSTLNNRKKSNARNAVRLYSGMIKFIACVCVGYVVIDILLSLNGI
jgi:hypothetical protein